VRAGPCQFPTLGFVVDQYKKVEAFIPENFWKIDMAYTDPHDRAAVARVCGGDASKFLGCTGLQPCAAQEVHGMLLR
jgi:DNA topoisomerase IA